MLLLLVLLSFGTTCIRAEATSESGNSIKPKSPVLSSLTRSSSLIQIAETEVFDGTSWKGFDRWTDPMTGKAVSSPAETVAPARKEWQGEWKIVTGGTDRDAYGWEYSVVTTHASQPMRRRLWVRAVVKTTQKKKKTSTSTPLWIRAIKDDFNFKGFGMTLYKSLVFPTSCGVAVRLPLTYNFDIWDRNPVLPSLSTAVSIYYPPMAMIAISGSLRVAFLQWLFHASLHAMRQSVLYALWTVIRGLWLAVGVLLFPLARKWLGPPPEAPVLLQAPWKTTYEPPVYSRTVEERIGGSVSWRISASRGYEFRRTLWHYYAPTLVSLWETNLLGSLLRRVTATTPAWFLRRSAAIGLSTSGPLREAPWIASSAALSLSGFYLTWLKRKRRDSESPASSIAETVSPQISALNATSVPPVAVLPQENKTSAAPKPTKVSL